MSGGEAQAVEVRRLWIPGESSTFQVQPD